MALGNFVTLRVKHFLKAHRLDDLQSLSGLADSVSLPARLGRDLHELRSCIPTSIRKRLVQILFSLEDGFREEQERTVLPVGICRFHWTSVNF